MGFKGFNLIFRIWGGQIRILDGLISLYWKSEPSLESSGLGAVQADNYSLTIIIGLMKIPLSSPIAGMEQTSTDRRSANNILDDTYIVYSNLKYMCPKGCPLETILEHGLMRERMLENPALFEECFNETCNYEEIVEYPDKV